MRRRHEGGGQVGAGSETPSHPQKKTPEERRALFAQAVADEERHGWRVESQEDFQAVMVRRRRGVYLIQLLLTALMSPQAESIGGDKREILSVDEYGSTHLLR
jgi:hypothetical protein